MPFVIHVSWVISHSSHNGHAMWTIMLANKSVNYVNMDNYMSTQVRLDNLVIVDMPCGQPCQLRNQSPMLIWTTTC